jgi:hypothetical protein
VTPALPLTRRALGLIEGAAPARSEAIAARLAEAGVAARPFHPGGVLPAAAPTGLATAVRELGTVVLGPRELELGDRPCSRRGASPAARERSSSSSSRPRSRARRPGRPS